MSSVVTSVFHNSLAESVVAEIQAGTSRYYYYFGNTVPSVGSPEEPLNTAQYIAQTRNSMITLSEINSNDVSYIIPRIDWTSGTRYEKYNVHTTGILTNFYVMTDAFNVYKCLDNDAADVLSTVKPTGGDVEPIRTADGYLWKFMYNVPLSLRNKFLTSAYIPVSTGLKNRFFGSGEIDSLSILSNGTGYTQGTTSISVTGDGTGAVLTPVITGGKLVDVTIDNPGIGYTFATINVDSSIVTDEEDMAVVIANMVNGNINSQQAIIENLTTPGTIDSVSVVEGGTGFTLVPTVVIEGDGTGATASATLFNGSLTKITMTSAGSGYTHATVTLTDAGIATGYDLVANMSPPLGHGRNAVKELFGNTLMFYGNVATSKVSGFTIDNDYRQFGLIKNIRSTQYDLEIPDQQSIGKFIIYGTEDVSSFVIDSVITDGTNTFTVTAVQVGPSMHALEVIPDGDWEPEVGTEYTRVTGSETFTSLALASSSLVNSKLSTLCYIVEGTFDEEVFVADSILLKDGKEFIVVAVMTGKLMIQSLDGGTISNGDVLTFGIENLLASVVTVPDADQRTGDILTIDNRAAFFQSDEQTVSTRTVIKF